jgi:hypothetical protein
MEEAEGNAAGGMRSSRGFVPFPLWASVVVRRFVSTTGGWGPWGLCPRNARAQTGKIPPTMNDGQGLFPAA